MNLKELFQTNKLQKEGVLMTHVYYGDPVSTFSDRLMETLLDNGADILELGIPYSDPVCDGPTFQQACMRSLAAGTTPEDCFEGIRKLRAKGYTQPVVITTYYNSIFMMGEERFMKRVKEVGAQAVIVPDIIKEESISLEKAAQKFAVDLIPFATPHSTKERLGFVLKNAHGFVYTMALSSTTGARAQASSKILKTIKLVKKVSPLPVLVGFGISSLTQAKHYIDGGADGVIIGSAIAKYYEKYLQEPQKALTEIADFIKSIKSIL